MKIYFLLPFALLVGLVVGGWGARTDLREARVEIKNLKRQVRDGGSSGRAVQIGEGVTSLLNIDSKPEERPKRQPKRVVRHKHEEQEPKLAETNEAAAVAVNENEKSDADVEPQDPQERFQENIDRAVELFEMRARIARATFIDRTGLDEEEAARFDVLVDAMNVRLANKIEKWVDDIEKKEDVGPEDGVRLVNGVTEAIVMAYDDFDRDMPEDWREKNDGEVNITDFIDPGIAMPLARVQGKMESGGRRNNRGGRGGIIF